MQPRAPAPKGSHCEGEGAPPAAGSRSHLVGSKSPAVAPQANSSRPTWEKQAVLPFLIAYLRDRGVGDRGAPEEGHRRVQAQGLPRQGRRERQGGPDVVERQGGRVYLHGLGARKGKILSTMAGLVEHVQGCGQRGRSGVRPSNDDVEEDPAYLRVVNCPLSNENREQICA
ncbi:unnamed protein product [Prorocentrum cordatum]|uniref:Uncharacterized protein n=1 Tax=Prorocentrum cordatum TaxID=2364126 RepID=A0ABN9S1H6_9DINO|nr:unnamed protein product [Polarella glacialis]